MELDGKHVCLTADGVVVELGLRVMDYDLKQGTVVQEPPGYEFEDSVCWPERGHNGHWWGVCTDLPGHRHELGTCRGKLFDGSRMTTRGVEAEDDPHGSGLIRPYRHP